MMKRFGKKAGIIAVGVCLLLMALLAGGVFALGEYMAVIETERPVALVIRHGDSLKQVVRNLSKDGLLSYPGLVTFLGVVRGDSSRIKAGEYLLEGSISANQFLDNIVTGRARLVSITIPEGFSLREIARRLEKNSLGSAAEFLRLCKDKKFIATLDLDIDTGPSSLEGFIYPETYFFSRGASEAHLIRTMVKQFKKKASATLKTGGNSGPLSPYEILVLASIIEKETGAGHERPLISAVFHNRLKLKMRLASDPTVIYGISDFDGNIKRIHLRAKTPYNTYKIRGLPPTPIANPGLESIKAAVSPANGKYLYFVSKGDGTHFFSKDFKTHNRAVYKYQILRHRRKRKS